MRNETLADLVVRGDRRAIARAITIVENRQSGASRLLDRIGKRTGNAFVVGVTGPPGTGKSSLVDRLIEQYARKRVKVGVIAVDPSSPFTGGALLGDRIRMAEHTLDKSVFIRSMATRGSTGGLSVAAADAIRILDAAGFRVIFVETVGIGQADIEIMRIAHIVVMVLMPGIGDEVQMSKAGLMEIGDVYVVNKSDLDGANQTMVGLLNEMQESKQKPQAVKVSARKGEGIEILVGIIEAKRATFNSEAGLEMRMKSTRGMILQLAKQRVVADIEERLAGDTAVTLVSQVARHRMSLETAVQRLLAA